MNTKVNDGINDESKRKIIGVIATIIPEASIYLFGSRARGTHSEWSDIDIALDSGEKISRHRIGEALSMLEASNIPYKVEIVDFNSVSENMRASILDERVLWKK